MGRKIGENVRNELKILDPISGSVFFLYYRIPTAEDRVAYTSAMFDRTGTDVKIRPTEARQEWGLNILEGFSDDAFEKKISDVWAPFSWDPQSPNYDPQWKELVKKYASDLLEALAFHVFEGAKYFPVQGEGFTEKN